MTGERQPGEANCYRLLSLPSKTDEETNFVSDRLPFPERTIHQLVNGSLVAFAFFLSPRQANLFIYSDSKEHLYHFCYEMLSFRKSVLALRTLQVFSYRNETFYTKVDNFRYRICWTSVELSAFEKFTVFEEYIFFYTVKKNCQFNVRLWWTGNINRLYH